MQRTKMSLAAAAAWVALGLTANASAIDVLPVSAAATEASESYDVAVNTSDFSFSAADKANSAGPAIVSQDELVTGSVTPLPLNSQSARTPFTAAMLLLAAAFLGLSSIKRARRSEV
jgi:hypothetical protein